MQEEFNIFNETVQSKCQSMVDQAEIDERIDITQIQQQPSTPLQSPDLLKYYYITRLLRAQKNHNINAREHFEDWMFKELVLNEPDATEALLSQENELI
ncbi:hypothetical protein INT46_007663 [Mucor plumbeus]|uniref:Uncharacterized protein n=1 Tax=Mucor plumbeus TaxID=97098 RepID=A0A8H7R7X7_9FUNG|nr:hypothetical protein INT46_007663 [Mucor plumbeus]